VKAREPIFSGSLAARKLRPLSRHRGEDMDEPLSAGFSSSGGAQVLRLRPRYYRIYTDPGVEVAERNYQYAFMDWEVPLEQVALVLIDVWNYHFASDTWERMEEVMEKNLIPLVAACRKWGLFIVHAPATPVAERHPNWVRLAPDFTVPSQRDPEWPPEDFVQRQGEYKPFARPYEPQDEDRKRMHDEVRDFHPKVKPVGDEPVVLNGQELHLLCKQRGVLFLFFAGFNTNACVIGRDYGVPSMEKRGYGCVLVRDATAGMETHETTRDATLTKATILNLEQFGTPTLGAHEIIDSLKDMDS
jgi:nicotinamidase-related amidase